MNPFPSNLLQRLSRRARLTDDANRHIVTVLAGHALRLVLGLASSAMLARGLGPEGLSSFSVVSAAMLIAITTGDFGLSNSAVRYVALDLKGQPSRALRTAQVFANLKLLGSAGVVIVSVILAGPLATLLGLPAESGPQFVYLAALGVLATSCSGVISTILRALSRFSYLVTTQTLNYVLTVFLLGALTVTGRLTIASALLVGAVTALAAASLGWLLLPPVWRPIQRAHVSLLGISAAGADAASADVSGTNADHAIRLRLWRFGRWLWISNFLVIALSQLDLLLLNRWAGAETTGYYALALNLSLKAAVLNQTLHTVLLPSVSGLSGWDQFVAYARRSLLRSILLALALLLALPLARPFILTVYGAVYAPSVSLFYLLIGVAIFEIVVDPLLMLAYPLNMARHIAASYVVRVAIMLIVGSLIIPGSGGLGAALAKLAANVLGALFLGSLLLLRLRRSLVRNE